MTWTIPPVGSPEDSDHTPEYLPTPATLPTTQIVHDLANFLTGIRMLVRSLAQVSPDEPVVKQHIESLDRAALHAAELCQQLQLSIRGEEDDDDIGGEEEEDEVEQQVCGVDLSAFVDGIRSLVKVMVRPGVTLVFELANDLPLVVANPTQLEQVLLDLLTNASDALAIEGGSIAIRTGIFKCNERPDLCALSDQARDDDDCVFLEVADTGCGIPEDKLSRIFDSSFTTKEGGHGLGLASVLRIISGYDGAVTVDSYVGRGTKVRCVFPAATYEQLERAGHVAAADPVDDETDSRPVTILLIEDNDAARYGSKLLLETVSQNPFQVLTARNGQEAMELFERRLREISLVVMDVNLPDCRGTQLFHQMRQLAIEVPIIVASGMPQEQLTEQFEGQLPDGILTKPFDGDALIEKVNMTLQMSRCETSR